MGLVQTHFGIGECRRHRPIVSATKNVELVEVRAFHGTPMQEILSYPRTNGFKTNIVTDFGQDFVRMYSEKVYGILPEQVIASALAVKYLWQRTASRS